MQFKSVTVIAEKMNLLLVIATLISISSSVGAQFYADYGDTGGRGPPVYHSLSPFDIPVIYKHNSLPAAYPVAPTIYEVALMKPIEPMPGKKTVPLYIIPEESLLVNPNNLHRAKRSLDPHGYRVNFKYPEFYGLTDGFHIPAVEIPLNKPMVVRQIEVNVLAPEGFMVPFHSDERQWPYPMTTGCLVASIPRNTYVSDDHPLTIRRLFAVPSLPEYPTYRPAFASPQLSVQGNHLAYPRPQGHGVGVVGQDGVTLNFFPNQQQQPQQPQSPANRQKGPVFELVPVTPKSSRRNGSRRRDRDRDQDNESDEDRERDREDEEDRDDSRDRDQDSKEQSESQEEERDRDRRCRGRNDRNCRRNGNSNSNNRDRNNSSRRRDRNRDRDQDRNRDRDRDRTTPTTTSTTTRPTTTTTTPTTTTPSTTTPAASSIQDIIAAFSSFRDRERERDERKNQNRISASFYEDEERDRSRQRPERPSRDREGLRGGDLRESSGSREDPEERERDRVPTESQQGPRQQIPPAENSIKELREQVLQRQIDQLQRLLTSLNLSQEGNSNNNAVSRGNSGNGNANAEQSGDSSAA